MTYRPYRPGDPDQWEDAILARGRRECFIKDGHCLTHDVNGDFGHYLETRPKEHNGHNPISGIAYND
jgi:hypothetical protein